MKLLLASILLGLLLLFMLIWSLSTLIGLLRARGVPFVPLKKRQIQAINKHIKLNQNDSLVDLGSGDGKVLRMFEKQGIKTAHGYEVNLWAVILAKISNVFSRSKSKVYFKNFNQVDLSHYNIVFCYLLDFSLKRLRGKFDQELKPGTKVISYAFEIEDWHKPEVIYTNPNNKKLDRIFIYTI